MWELVLALAEYERLAHCVTGTEADFRRWLFEESVVEVLVAELGDLVVGYALFFKNFSTFRMQPGIWLEDLFVLPEHRGAGIGKRLIGSVIELARDRGFGRVEWSVLDWNQTAIDFYKAIGANVMDDWRICRISL